LTDTKDKYKPMSMPELCLELGVPQSQRGQPDLTAAVANRFVSKEEATARGMSKFWDGTIGSCRYGHQAPRFLSNPKRCTDCDRVKAGLEPIYGKSRVNRHYPEPRRKAVDPNAPPVTAALAAAPAAHAPPEMPKRDTDWLAALAETGDFDKACALTGTSRGLIEARASANEIFRRALNDLIDRRGIAWTRAPDASTFKWSPEIERQYVRAYIDCGMAQQARTDLGISASDFHARLASSQTFASLVEDAHPLAALTLKDRATQAAAVGKIDLLKYLEANAPKDDLSNMSHEQANAEIIKLLLRFEKQGVLVEPTTDAGNADLVGA
jgi:hypothetical protein